MDEGKFWLLMIVPIAAFFFGVVGFSIYTANENYKISQSECIQSGASWVPTTSYNAICLKK